VPFRHVVLYKFAEHVGEEHLTRLGSALDELRELVPGIRSVTHGADAGMVGEAFDYTVVVDVATAGDWRTARDHPAYILLVEELLTPHIVEQATGHFRIDDHAPTEPTDVDARDLTDDELMEHARRSAQASMGALLAEPDDIY
jgi:Stress responsive A/B Barrel Domain